MLRKRLLFSDVFYRSLIVYRFLIVLDYWLFLFIVCILVSTNNWVY